MARNKYDVDEVVEQKFDIKQLKRLVDYIRPYKGKMLFVLVLMLSSSGLGMFLPKFLQIEMDKYIPDKDIKSIVMLTALAGVIVLYSVISTRHIVKLLAEFYCLFIIIFIYKFLRI